MAEEEGAEGMSEPKMCCNCLHCARWRRKDGIETHCDLTDKYLGYLKVMDEDNDCKHWEKETKWDLQREHDAKVRAEVLDEILEECKKKSYSLIGYGYLVIDMKDVRKIVDKSKEQNDGRI